MGTQLVSILIPFYNEETLIQRAIMSCINQTYKNIEIILVDDFSTDNSINIVNKMAVEYPNLIYVHSHKKGVGAARNSAFNKMKGEFYTFLDADDELDKNFISVCFQKAKETNSDVIVVNTQVFDSNSNQISKFNYTFDDRYFANQLGLNEIYNYNINPSAWGKLISSKLTFSFPETIFYEDKPFVVNILISANKVCLISDKLYRHHSNQKSITRKTIYSKLIEDNVESFFLELGIIDSNAKEEIKNDLIKNAFQFQLKIMLDIYFIIKIDKPKLDFEVVSRVYQKCISKIKKEIIRRKVKLTFKSKILLIILNNKSLNRMKLTSLILKKYKKIQFDFIKKIKNKTLIFV
jgi:glycosyltransferase involved in cell wall biosynthesis